MSDEQALSPKRRIPPILVGVVLSLLVLLAIASLGSYRDLSAARQRQQYLEERIDDTRSRNDRLSSQIRRLKTDPASLERVAREQYRMQRPDDIVVVFPSATEPDPRSLQDQ